MLVKYYVPLFMIISPEALGVATIKHVDDCSLLDLLVALGLERCSLTNLNATAF
jgi:hypothetical protein